MPAKRAATMRPAPLGAGASPASPRGSRFSIVESEDDSVRVVRGANGTDVTVKSTEHMAMSTVPSSPIIEGLIETTDLFVTAGPSKVGKTNSLVHAALCVSRGEPWLGRATQRCDVLIVSLDEQESVTADRLIRFTPEDEEVSNDFRVSYMTEGMWAIRADGSIDPDSGLAFSIDAWLALRPEGRLVIVDTWALSLGSTEEKNYCATTKTANSIKDFARSRGIAIWCITHTRKMPAQEDAFEAVMGTAGLMASSTGMMVYVPDYDRAAKTTTGTGALHYRTHHANGSIPVTVADGVWVAREAQPTTAPPPEGVEAVAAWFRGRRGAEPWSGSATALARDAGAEGVSPSALAKRLRKSQAWLAAHGVLLGSRRTHDEGRVLVLERVQAGSDQEG